MRRLNEKSYIPCKELNELRSMRFVLRPTYAQGASLQLCVLGGMEIMYLDGTLVGPRPETETNENMSRRHSD